MLGLDCLYPNGSEILVKRAAQTKSVDPRAEADKLSPIPMLRLEYGQHMFNPCYWVYGYGPRPNGIEFCTHYLEAAWSPVSPPLAIFKPVTMNILVRCL